MKRPLYLPQKYPVIVGQGKGIGFCTVWSDPEWVLASAPWLKERTALIGTLYSQEGVNIILRNLCLNPDIRYLIVWAKGELSQTSYGQAGVQVLRHLWQKGVDSQGRVKGTQFFLHPEMDLRIIRQVIKTAFPIHQPLAGEVFPKDTSGVS